MTERTANGAETDAHLPSGVIQLYDNYRPGLEAGAYQVTVRQNIGGLDTGSYFTPHVQSFTVGGPRFALAPGDVGEVFPPADSNGVYGNVLPSVVLNQRTLPWERAITADPAVPWLALLTFETGEIVPDPGTGLPLRVSTVAEFLTSAEHGVLTPKIPVPSVPADVLAGTVVSVVVPLATFTALAPSLPEATLLAHARQTDTAHQAESAAASDGWYSVVIGNRFPNSTVAADGTGARNLACLVSLEGLTAYLPGGGGPPVITTTAPNVRLAVLASWSFVSHPAATESFARLMGHLVAEEGAGGPAPLALPVPASAPASPATARLAEGYIPLSYHTASGEDTFAWYRGPCTPVVPPPLPTRTHARGHYAVASDVTIYLEAHGVFDLSYAAAYEAGRLAALADKGFTVALVNSRRGAHRTLSAARGRLLTGLSPARPADPRPTWRLFGERLRDGMGAELSETLAQVAGPPGTPPPSTPTRPQDPDPVAATRTLLAHDQAQDLLAEHVTQTMDPVTDWLARLALLHQVPFRHLVPDERMLPVESIRFFYLDDGWIAALLDGALSVGVEGSRDLELHDAWSAPMITTIAEKLGGVRAALRDRPDLAVATGVAGAAAGAAAGSTRTGFLLRSAVVSGWPGLVVQADGGATPLLRLDRLSDTVLLAIFDGVPGSVTLGEPWHGLRFGLQDGQGGQDGHLLRLRAPDGTSLNTRFPAPSAGDVLTSYTRPATGATGRRVLTAAALAHDLYGALGGAAHGAPMGSALFATELLLTPQQLTFHGPEPAAERPALAPVPQEGNR